MSCKVGLKNDPEHVHPNCKLKKLERYKWKLTVVCWKHIYLIYLVNFVLVKFWQGYGGAFGQVFHPSDNKVQHCTKSVHIRSYSVLVISLRIQSECEKMRTRITPNTDTFYAVQHSQETHYIHSNNQEKVIHKVFTSFQKMWVFKIFW